MASPRPGGNCFAGNDVRSTLPVGLELFQPCQGLRLPVRMDFSTALHSLGSAAEGNTDAYPHIASRDVPPPPAQPGLPGAAAAPVRPAVDVYHGVNLDLDTIARPAWPAGLEVTTRKEPMPDWLRLTVLGGGIAAYLIVLAVGASLGGIA